MGVCIKILFLFLTVQLITCQKLITILSDFTKNSDLDFFKNTFPWIIDNLGSDIRLSYHFKDSGKNSGPRKCALLQLNKNAYLQAEYLKCEATGHQSTECIKSLPIDTVKYNKCVKLKVNSFVKSAEKQFNKIKPNSSPVILLPRKKVVVDIKPQSVLESICTLYLKTKPIGCINPKPVPQNKPENESKTEIEHKTDTEDKANTKENSTSTIDKNDSEKKKTDENQKKINLPSTTNEETTTTNIEENKQSHNDDTKKEKSTGD